MWSEMDGKVRLPEEWVAAAFKSGLYEGCVGGISGNFVPCFGARAFLLNYLLSHCISYFAS